MYKKNEGVGSPQPAEAKKDIFDGIREDKVAYDLVDMGAVNPHRFLRNKSSKIKAHQLPIIIEEIEAVEYNLPENKAPSNL
ncbi:hypothetical protein OQJ13_12165 [Legionella sp. PATHC035]|uniref:hypothetical protein n=1 Tax=Legionella sp. PATHC035 TaxID=2992040 RepID=UPI0022433C27|nr:hypothetical protein [Legionella sp. PATHC035]MCW8409724.1 hypothetical protein [Legionella sp. PATHC035]